MGAPYLYANSRETEAAPFTQGFDPKAITRASWAPPLSRSTGRAPPYANAGQAPTLPFSNGFDPKAVSRASWAPPPPKPKAEGPLINFNKHPDSWRQAPYGMTNAMPMPKNTKRNVKAARWVQLALRSLNLIGAVGTTVLLACLSNIPMPQGWIIRSAPALDVVMAVYATFHLMRSPKTKAPGSSASYHFFTIILDIPLIPFYLVIAFNDRWNISQPVDNKNRWKSLFKVQATTDKLIDYTWIVAIVVAGIHVFTAFIAIYLVRMFRKIANLPPDLNPLEDNLTSRCKSKHKYKSSDMSEASKLHSKHDSGISLPWEDQSRPVSFLHTRNDSSSEINSIHKPKAAGESQTSLPISAPSIISGNDSKATLPNIAARSSDTLINEKENTDRPKPPTRAGSPLKQTELSRLNSVAASSVYSDKSGNSTPALPRKSSKRVSGTFTSTENWYAIHEDEDNENIETFSILDEEDDEVSRTSSKLSSRRSYQPVRQASTIDVKDGDLGDGRYAPTPPSKSPAPSPLLPKYDALIALDPLGMNPPTPPPQSASGRDLRPKLRSRVDTSDQISIITTSSTPTTPISRSPSPTKSRYYGDLKTAYQAVRSSPKQSPKTKSSPTKEPGPRIGEWLNTSRLRVDEKRAEKEQQAQYERLNSHADGRGRVISRSGIDLDDGVDYLEDVPGQFQSDGARNVSGKVAEEGYGGGWARRRVSAINGCH